MHFVPIFLISVRREGHSDLGQQTAAPQAARLPVCPLKVCCVIPGRVCTNPPRAHGTASQQRNVSHVSESEMLRYKSLTEEHALIALSLCSDSRWRPWKPGLPPGQAHRRGFSRGKFDHRALAAFFPIQRAKCFLPFITWSQVYFIRRGFF